VKKPDELYNFVASNYYATGEGSTTSLLITRAYPRSEDYEVQPETIYTDGKYQLNPGILANGAGFRAIREFAEVFDGWYARGAEIYTWENFEKKYKAYIPLVVSNIMNSDDTPGNFHWHQQIHMNFS
jgi:hypothetical protein